MRILHVGKFFPPSPGGMETFLYDLTVEQQLQGNRVSAIVHQHRARQPTVRETIEGVEVCRVRTYGSLLYTPISPGFRRELHRQIALHQPDVLHFHVPNASAFAALASHRASRVPWVATWHSDVVASTIDSRLALAYKAYRPFEQRFLARCSFILPSSEAYLEASSALAPWRSKCAAVPLGIAERRLPDPTAETLAWAASQWQHGLLRVICIGRLTYYKGHRYLLEAVARVPDVQLCVVGSGRLGPQLQEMVTRLQLNDRVKMLGFVEDARTQALLATSDTLVLPSVERTEAFGLVLLEAMRYEKSVIASDIPGSGPGWIVRQGRSGLTVPPGDVPMLASALAKLRDDPALRDELGTRAAAAFAKHFQIGRVASDIQEFYKQACGCPVAAAGKNDSAMVCR